MDSLLHLDDDTLREVCFNADTDTLYHLIQTNKRVRNICKDILELRYLALAYAIMEKGEISLSFSVEKLPGVFSVSYEIETEEKDLWTLGKDETIYSSLIYEENIDREVNEFFTRLLQEKKQQMDVLFVNLNLHVEDPREKNILDRFLYENFKVKSAFNVQTLKDLVRTLVDIFFKGGRVTINSFHEEDSNYDVDIYEGEEADLIVYDRAREIEQILRDR